MTLDSWLDRIQQLHPKAWDLGLERVGEVARRLGVTRPAPKVVLVAGTNGKGSTCEMIELLARRAGLRVGKTTSPHLIRFNERITIDGQSATDDEIVAAFEAIDDARGDISLSYFEFGALAAMLIFKQREVDLAVLEIGLGGRLDAMNVVDPDVSVITRIALDHQDWLGDDREAIGAEKAGIMRPGKPCILGDPDPPASVLDAAAQLGATLHRVGSEFGVDPASLPTCPVPGENVAAAVEAVRALGVELDTRTTSDALAGFALPGRRQWVRTRHPTLLDVAHNPDAAESLAAYLDAEGIVQCDAVFGCYADKDISGLVRAIAPRVRRWYLAAMDETRAAKTDELARIVGDSDGVVAGEYAKVADAYEAALECAEKSGVILIFGSFNIVGGALEHLGEQLP